MRAKLLTVPVLLPDIGIGRSRSFFLPNFIMKRWSGTIQD
jgi:hypothetical protein